MHFFSPENLQALGSEGVKGEVRRRLLYGSSQIVVSSNLTLKENRGEDSTGIWQQSGCSV